jgi:gamma-polyglutamate synthase
LETILSIFILYLIFLGTEAIVHNRRLRRIPLRITVSGTRGKSGVTRDIAAVLRADGRKVLAKTTGTEPRYILPDGSEEPVHRRGLTTIMEQKRVVSRAIRLGADCLVVEVMSIRPENHRTESGKLIKPHITVLTNFRPDHLDVTGSGKTETEAVFLNDIYEGSTVFIHRNHISELLAGGIEKLKSTLVTAEPGIASGIMLSKETRRFRVEENTELVTTVASRLDINRDSIAEGLSSSRHDSGQAALYKIERNGKKIWFASTFAANDPLSTTSMMGRIIEDAGIKPTMKCGLLLPRADRGERTLQWIEFLKNDHGKTFDKLFVAGIHSKTVARRLPGTITIKTLNPEEMMNQIADNCSDGAIVFGLANIGGTGLKLINYLAPGGR